MPNETLQQTAGRKLDQLDSAEQLDDVRIPARNRLEAPPGSGKSQYSIRVNEQFRICFVWAADGPSNVEIVDYH